MDMNNVNIEEIVKQVLSGMTGNAPAAAVGRWMSAILALTMALALTACGGSNSSTGSINWNPEDSQSSCIN